MNERALVPITSPQNKQLAPRRGIMARLFGAHEAQTDLMRADHALARLAIELDADLTSYRRKAHHYLEVTALEDRAVKEITKAQRCEEICEQVDELFDYDPLTAAVLKAKVLAIFNHHNHPNRHYRG